MANKKPINDINVPLDVIVEEQIDLIPRTPGASIIPGKSGNIKTKNSENENGGKEEDAKNVNTSLRDGKNGETISKESVITIDTVDRRASTAAAATAARNRRQEQTYAAKKTVAQGMMDIALITANANQLRYLVEYQRNSATFFINVTLIVISLLLQIAVGISLIFRGRFDMQGKSKSPQARRLSNYVVVGVFLITIINVFVAAFSVSPANPSTIPPVVVPTLTNVSV